MLKFKNLNSPKLISVWVLVFYSLISASILWANQYSTPQNQKWIGLAEREDTIPQMNLLESNFNQVEFELKIFGMWSGEIETKGGVFTELSIPEYGITNVIGEPKLPVIRKMVQIPYGATVNVEVIASEVSEKSLSELGIANRIIPVQPPIPKIEGAWEKAEFVIHEDFYQTDQFFPTQLAKKGEIGIIRGHRFVMVEVYPLSYNPKSGRVRICSDIRIRVNLTGSDRSTTENMLSRYASPPFEELCQDLFINYSTYADLLKGLPTLPIEYLIIVHDSFYVQVAPLQEWKTKKGFHVTVAKTSQTGSTTTAIKNYIQTAYNNWPIPPTYVLFFGDVGFIPTYTGSFSGTATDLYYVQMNADRFGDIFRARFPVRTTGEATDMVNKLLYYENPTSSDLEWMRHDLFIASSDMSAMAEFTHRYVIQNFLLPNGDIIDSLWERLGGVTATAISNSINAGKAIVCYSGHGSQTSWATGSYGQSNIRGLSNSNEYPLVLSHACLTGQFDQTECFGETWVKVPNKGGIAFWGASNSSYWDEDDILEKRMFRAAFQDTCYSVASMTDKGLWYLYQYYGDVTNVKYYFDMYNVLGDPSVDIWTYIANDLLVDFPSTIPMASSEVTIAVNKTGGPVYGALVCLRKGAEVFESGYTNTAGQVTLSVSPTTPGYLELTVTAHNVLPLEDSIMVVPGAYVLFDKWYVDDDSLGESRGNSDGDVDLGETIELPIVLRNLGDSTALNVQAVLSTTNPLITMSDSQEIYGNIAGHDTVRCPDDFGFVVSPQIEDSELVTFQLDITATNGSWTYRDLNLLVHAPVLVYKSNIVDDIGGNGNGEPDPGETCDVTVTLKNKGSQKAIGVSANLICNDSYVTVTASGSAYPDIFPDSTVSSLVPYQFDVHTNCPPGYPVEFVLEITGAGPYSVSDTFHISVGRKPVLLVDDDNGAPYDSFFVSALNSLGILCDVWRYKSSGMPSDSVVGSYKAVVWTTGEDFGSVGNPSTLTAEDQANLKAYLESGGKLFLSSQDLLFDNNPNDFIINYLHVAGHTDDAGENSVAGVASDTISNGMSVTLSYPFSNLSDYIVPGAGAAGIFYRTGKSSPALRGGSLALSSLPLGSPDQTNYCALRYPASGTAGYQVVFFVFPFEAIPQNGADPNNAETVMGRIMNWFGIGKPSFLRGDANGDGGMNSADVVYLINYLFVGGPSPTPLEAGDADCSGEVNATDVVFLINYLFIGGPPPSC
jgi:hypothetical protein